MKVYRKLIFLLALIILTGFFSKNTLANEKITIESYNKTLASGHIEAYTFKEAVLKLCADNDISIAFDPLGAEIISVNGIRNNHFSVYDCWQGYIMRGGTVIQSPDILSVELLPGDILKIYYGHTSDTKIVTDFYCSEQNGNLSFHLSSSGVVWHENGGEWISGKVTENLQNIRINITEPGGTRKIVQTSDEGLAESPLTEGGVYKIYAEGYKYNNNPSIVKTSPFIYFYSTTGENYITRAEACAFFVQSFNLKQTAGAKSFSDVNEKTGYYKEIIIAASNNLVSGYENGEFKPDEPVSLLQLGVILSKLYPNIEDNSFKDTVKLIEGVPLWAQEAAQKIIKLGLFENVGYNWQRNVTKEDLSIIYETVCFTF